VGRHRGCRTALCRDRALAERSGLVRPGADARYRTCRRSPKRFRRST
jgi:hypothetical protein